MIEQGDIICIHGRGWLSDGILKAEYGDKIPAMAASHCGVFLAGQDVSNPIVIEALARVRTNLLSQSISDCLHAYALHDRSLDNNQRLRVLSKACAFSTDGYGYVDLVAQWLDATTRSTWWTDRLRIYLGHHPICSYVVAAAYEDIGLDFGVDSSTCKPSDVLGFALKHPEIYDVIPLK